MNASLYLHIPFCEHKCIYCDFYSIAPGDSAARDYAALIREFLVSLEAEIRLRSADRMLQCRFETIFFGGGTPSLLSPSDLQRVLDLLRSCFTIDPDAEVTVETNPGTVDPEKLAAFRAAGINRLSIGIQSFHEDDLRFLTRIHSSDQAKACVRAARDAGFQNISLDLMFSLPGQTKERWMQNLEEAIALEPQHISCYSLIVEPDTPLQRMVETKQIATLPPEMDAELYETTIQMLASSGFQQYEVSNFARPGFHSRHNLNYWRRGNYLGFGPSAHSHWTDVRWWNVSNLHSYTQRIAHGQAPVAGEERLSREQVVEEEMFLGLRSTGIDVAGFRRRHDIDLFERYGDIIEDLLRSGLAVLEHQVLRLTSTGYSLCDEIALRLR
ncbi:MAG: coproporphyrinogen III oxidase [Bacteroidia bacterium]|nr:MAG: coproporphyrinogen III oxidase [Bacteroidia bacterium]